LLLVELAAEGVKVGGRRGRVQVLGKTTTTRRKGGRRGERKRTGLMLLLLLLVLLEGRK